MTSFLLFVLFLLTVVLGRVRQLGAWRFSRLIPSMTFFRVALAAGLLSRMLIGLGLQGEIVDWIAVVAKTGLFVALAELALDLIWVVLARLSQGGVAPPRILKDLALVVAAFVTAVAHSSAKSSSSFSVSSGML